MVNASELAKGMVIRVEGQVYRVLQVEAKAAAAKLGGVVKAELCNVITGRLWEARFRPQERLEDLPVDRRNMEFLFRESETCTFMDPNSFEQIEVPGDIAGPAAGFLQSGTQVPVEFFEGRPIHAMLPDIVEARVVQTAPPAQRPQTHRLDLATLHLQPQAFMHVRVGPLLRVRGRDAPATAGRMPALHHVLPVSAFLISFCCLARTKRRRLG